MPAYSLIIPLYNRPAEMRELLLSLTRQSFTDFEVIVVEDGSSDTAESICNEFTNQLNVRYFYKTNEGPGLTRNYGCHQAHADFFIFFDSDCLLPPDYLHHLEQCRRREHFDAYGGPDAADETFSPWQKGINYAMTAVLTTGGIRGSKKAARQFHPRSFNMGISKTVFGTTGGFSTMRFGEDIDFSLRILAKGFKSKLITNCFVYHKRRSNARQFFKQVYNSGIARINLYKRHPHSLKLLHWFPAVFTLYFVGSILAMTFSGMLWPALPWGAYFAAILIDAWRKAGSLKVSCLSVLAAFFQLTGYGLGFIKGVWHRLILGRPEFHAFDKTFYK